MSRFLYRLGGAAAGHPWRTVCAWVLLTLGVLAASTTFGGTPQDDYDVPGARAQVGIEMLREHDPALAGTSAQVLVHADRGTVRPDVLATLRTGLTALDHVAAVPAPRLSGDGDTALFTVLYDVPVTDPDLMGDMSPLERAASPAEQAGYRVELGGDLPSHAAAPMDGRGELIGVVVALALLVLVFGSVVAAGLPVVIALTGLAVGSAGIGLLAAVMDVSTAAPTVASMVGLGVGIDYALLLITRHVEFLGAGHPVRESAARATATAGRSVVFASATVLVSLLGLRLAGLPVYSSFGFATAIGVLSVMAAAITLVPALAGLAGTRLLPKRVRRGRPAPTTEPLTARWAARVGARPLPWALAAVLVLLSLAAPALAMRTWPQDASSQSRDLTTRQAYDLVSEEFGPGANAPMTVVADLSRVGRDEVDRVAAALATYPGVSTVGPVTTSPDGALAVLVLEPDFGPTDARVDGLVASLRDDVLPAGAELTGGTPFFSDIADMLAGRIWLVIGFVVGVSVLLLAMMFRSVVVPVKAAVMNLLSIGAAYGVLTAAFQWGWATGLLGLDHAMPVSSWVPILMFAILFGLSMDYEVFLLSRIREDYLATGDARGSVVRGLSSTGRVISAAAAIMVAVFLGFATETDVVVKMLGFGMAVAIVLDATVVRMVLVPATMAMLGRLNWWLPGWLDRLLPTLHAELPGHPGPALVPAAPQDPDEERMPVGV
ncbi:MMPL family transporter [Nocardioides mesophilus]|uniref:MMPL family transporter n=1 Tax=Nocardioides mesophilus TaxID=433659 RepID=A0A7G9RBH6_9ACTN|nr:MMPL family transporter [Nocardioides mesophilus]QNN52951.1 MMPL family transporter [Nocardioides mesophilus]